MKYVIFGAGIVGRRALALLPRAEVAFFVDNDAAKDGAVVDGIPVRYYGAARGELADYQLVVALSARYEAEVLAQLGAAGIKAAFTYTTLVQRETRRRIESRPDYLGIYERAIDWIYKNTLIMPVGRAIINTTSYREAYPEVTGYYIPTLLQWGHRELALDYAKWLIAAQKADGSWYDTADEFPYVFDTGQILKGLVAIRTIYPAADDAIVRGIEWLLSNMEPSGRLTTPDKSSWDEEAERFELIHLYTLRPVLDAAEIFGREDWRSATRKIASYYVTNFREDILSFPLLSHFYAYVMEALLDLGYEDLVREAMARVARLQTADGAVPAYRDVSWVCSTGLFQLALVWLRLGERERGNLAFSYAARMQNPTGGWFGSYPSATSTANDYIPNAEISWATKYFLDALYYKNKADFDESAPQFKSTIPKSDGRYQAILSTAKSIYPQGGGICIIDVGCGKGRYLRNLEEDLPEATLYGVDISAAVIAEKGESAICYAEGTLTNIPYEDNKFNLAYACESLEHAIDIRAAIREMARVVRPGGKIIIVDKNIEQLGVMDICEWEQWFDEQELATIMQEHCASVEVLHSVDYEDHYENLFSVWIGIVK